MLSLLFLSFLINIIKIEILISQFTIIKDRVYKEEPLWNLQVKLN